MSFQVEMEIKLPRRRVLELFLDPDNVPKWQRGLVTTERISGKDREVGAKTRSLHSMGGRELWITETITVHDYPEKFCAIYEGGGTHNLIENYFSEAGPHKTKWVLLSDFSNSNLLIRLMTIFMPGMFKKQTVTFMNYFREFAESYADQPVAE